MIFVMDIGNTNTVIGVFQHEKLIYEWRIKTDKHKTEDEFAILFKSLFDFHGITFADFSAVVISSVVPPIMSAMEAVCEKYFHVKPFIIHQNHVKSILKMTYPNPKEIGADRIVNAVATIELYGAPALIIDFGTATTYCYVNQDQSYVGGIITPGIQISLEALYHKAAKLPKVEIQKPDSVIGKSTIGAMQSGIFYGYIGQVDGIVKRMIKDQKEKPKVIATGGLAKLFQEDSEVIDIVDQHLTLKGLYIIYKRNQ